MFFYLNDLEEIYRSLTIIYNKRSYNLNIMINMWKLSYIKIIISQKNSPCSLFSAFLHAIIFYVIQYLYKTFLNVSILEATVWAPNQDEFPAIFWNESMCAYSL